MSSRRTLILLGAIAVGVLAALLLFNYVRGIEDRANDNAKRVDVFAAQSDIVRGTPGETASTDGSIAQAKIPQEFRPSTAITSTDEIEKKVALFDIAQGTVIVQGMFVDPAQTQISFRARLENPEHVAISISVDEVRSVAGFLVPGDEVNILIFQNLGDDVAAAPGTTGTFDQVARYLYQKVQILAVGASTVLSPGEQASAAEGESGSSGSSGLITFNVPPDAAQLIAMAQAKGDIYLSLVAEDYVPKELPPPDPAVGLLPGEDPAVLTPYGPSGNTE